MAPHNFTPVLTHLLLTSLSDHRHDTNSTVIDRVLNSNFNSLNTLFNFEISSCIIRRLYFTYPSIILISEEPITLSLYVTI